MRLAVELRLSAMVAVAAAGAVLGTVLWPGADAALYMLALVVVALLALTARPMTSLIAALGLLALLGLRAGLADSVLDQAGPIVTLDRLLLRVLGPALNHVTVMVLVVPGLVLPLVAICAWWAGRPVRPADGSGAPTTTVRPGPRQLAGEDAVRRAVWRPAGLRQAEAELARSRQRQGEVSLALIGLDGHDSDTADEEVRLLDLLDELALAEIAPSDVLSAYGPLERLLVLPDVSACGLRAGAGRLCVAAAQRVGRPVRIALATFPEDGGTLRYLLDGLERDLADRRKDGHRRAAERPLPQAEAVGAGKSGPPRTSSSAS
jgi:hypothetical protein